MKLSKSVIARNKAISGLCRSGRLMLCIMFCLFLSAEALAQNGDTTHRDNVRKFIIVDARTPSKSDKALIVVDDKIYKRRLKKIDTNNIVSIEILKGKEAKTQFGEKGRNGVVVIVTKKYAIQQYQKKFSTFSKEYKDYLESNHSDDSGFLYLINGPPLEQIYIETDAYKTGETWKGIKRLLDLPTEKIRNVSLLDSDKFPTAKKIVVIKINKD